MTKVERYISTLKLADKIMELFEKAQKDERQDIMTAISKYVMPAISATPTEAVTVGRSGHWNVRSVQHIEYGNTIHEYYLECSECGRKVPIKEEEVLEYHLLCAEYPYCHCGAYMDPVGR